MDSESFDDIGNSAEMPGDSTVQNRRRLPSQWHTAVIRGLSMLIALMTSAWSLAHIHEPGRLAIGPAAIICGVAYPLVLPVILFVAYLTPSIILHYVSVMSILPWLLAAIMLLNVASSPMRQFHFRVPRSVIIAFLLFALTVAMAELNAGSNNFVAMSRVAAYILFFPTIWQYRTEFDKKFMIFVIMACSSALALWTIWRFQHSGSDQWFARGTRIEDPNYLARWIGIGTIPAIALLLHRGREIPYNLLVKVVAAAVVIITGLALAYCASRGAAIAFAFTILTMILYSGFRERRLIFAIVILLALAFLGPMLWKTSIFNVYRERFSAQTVYSANQRIPLIKAALNYWCNTSIFNKFVGAGTGSTYAILGGHSHNNFIDMLMDYGLFGLSAFLALLWVTWRSANRQNGLLCVISVGWVVFMCVSCLDLCPFQYIWAWQIFALIISIPLTVENRTQNTT
jgi:hypothetical protein